MTMSMLRYDSDVAVRRLVRMFRKYGLKQTFFLPARCNERYPATVEIILEGDHEIGHHGYLHEAFDQLSAEEVRDVIRRGNEALQRSTGRRPTGMRVPAGDFDGSLFEILVDEGFRYDSSVIGEFRPSWCRSRDELHDDRPPTRGERLDLVELPLSFVMNDFSYFEFNYANPTLVGLSSPDHVFGIWSSQFDYMYDHEPGGVLNLTLHPQSIGWGLRIAMLERFLVHCLEREGAEFATCEAVAARFREGELATAAPGRNHAA
jgi:peptidoglycan-N-acetylglucosamine deacetylase